MAATRSIWVFAIIGAIFLYVALPGGLSWGAVRTPAEEKMLINYFGDEYRSYMKRTGAFIPKIKLSRG